MGALKNEPIEDSAERNDFYENAKFGSYHPLLLADVLCANASISMWITHPSTSTPSKLDRLSQEEKEMLLSTTSSTIDVINNAIRVGDERTLQDMWKPVYTERLSASDEEGLKAKLQQCYFLFDRIFFFGTLYDRIPLEFYHSSRMNASNPDYEVACRSLGWTDVFSDLKTGKIMINLKWIGSSRFATFEQRLDLCIKTLIHELVHAFLEYFSRVEGCRPGMSIDMLYTPRFLGLSGHGELWVRVANAIEARMKKDMDSRIDLGIEEAEQQEAHCCEAAEKKAAKKEAAEEDEERREAEERLGRKNEQQRGWVSSTVSAVTNFWGGSSLKLT